MAIALTSLGAFYPGFIATGSTATFNISTTSGCTEHIFLMNVSGTGGTTPAQPTLTESGGATVTARYTVLASLGDQRLTYYTFTANSTGTHTITIHDPGTDAYGCYYKASATEASGGAAEASIIDVYGTAAVGAVTTMTLAAGPTTAPNEYALVGIATRAYGGAVAQSAPGGWTELNKNLHTDGTSWQIWSGKQAEASSGTSISQAFTWSGTMTGVGAAGIIVSLKAASSSQRAKITFDVSKPGVSAAIGATSVTVYLWPPAGPVGASWVHRYDNVPIIDGGSGVPIAYLDVGTLGMTNGDTPVYILTGVENSSGTPTKGSVGLRNAVVENGAGTAWAA